jgi:hypothetical protein
MLLDIIIFFQIFHSICKCQSASNIWHPLFYLLVFNKHFCLSRFVMWYLCSQCFLEESLLSYISRFSLDTYF